MTRPLVNATELATMLASDAPPVVLDVRWVLQTGADHDAFLQGHIPGARFVHMEHDLSSTPGAGGRHPMPAAEVFAAAMRRVGVDDDSSVVCYDGGSGMSAARAWWLLRRFGHADVVVLDGGLPAWIRAGQPVVTEEASVVLGDFTIGEPLAAAVEVDDVLAAAENGILLDARDLERYQGLVEPMDAVAGHIPGATSAATKENVQPDGTFLPPEQLRERFAGLGVTDDTAITVYCGSGVTAAHEILALESAGFSAALYPGSWSHWITDPTRPVATDSD